MDYENEISLLIFFWNKQFESLNNIHLEIEKISRGIANSSSIEEKRANKLFLADAINATKINRQNLEEVWWNWQEESMKLTFEDERQMVLNQVVRINATNLQHGFEILQKLEIEEAKLSKLIRNSIAREIKSSDFLRFFVKKLKSGVYKKFNNVSSQVYQLQGTINPKLYGEFDQILKISADTIGARSTETAYAIKQIFDNVQNTNHISNAARKARKIISLSIQKCVAAFNLCVLKINTIWKNRENHSNHLQKKCKSKKYTEKESVKSFNKRNIELKNKQNFISKMKKVEQNHQFMCEIFFKCSLTWNSIRPINWKVRKRKNFEIVISFILQTNGTGRRF